MKKSLVSILILLSVFIIVACSQDSPHEHTFSTDWSSDTEYHWHNTTCGHDEKSDYSQHSWNEGVITTPSSCTESGIKSFTCIVCGRIKTESIPETGHAYSGVITTAAGCETTGVITYTCSNCGDAYTESVPATGHAYTEVITTEAKCNTAGEGTYTCSNCGDVYTAAIPATGHAYSGVITTAAGCETTGVITYTCSNCGDVYTESVPATGHAYTEVITTEANCNTAGVATHTCANCGDVYTTSISATNKHTWENNGSYDFCSVCGLTKTPYIGPSGGYVFYDKGEYSDGWRFLEAAPVDLRVVNGVPTIDSSQSGYSDGTASIYFGFYRTTNSGNNLYVNGTTSFDSSCCTEFKVGKGEANTQLLVAAMGAEAYLSSTGSEKIENYAARLCDILTYTVDDVTYDDWFLPSIDELAKMNDTIRILGGFFDKQYWSSTESSGVAAYRLRFDSYGTEYLSNRYSTGRIRPIRAF